MDRNHPPEEYAVEVMTFGATCSPYCAQLAKNENALEFQRDFPPAVDSIVSKHYVDDLLDSCLLTAARALLLRFAHRGHGKDEDSHKECSSHEEFSFE